MSPAARETQGEKMHRDLASHQSPFSIRGLTPRWDSKSRRSEGGFDQFLTLQGTASGRNLTLGRGKIGRQAERLGGAKHRFSQLVHRAHLELPNSLARDVKAMAQILKRQGLVA